MLYLNVFFVIIIYVLRWRDSFGNCLAIRGEIRVSCFPKGREFLQPKYKMDITTLNEKSKMLHNTRKEGQ